MLRSTTMQRCSELLAEERPASQGSLQPQHKTQRPWPKRKEFGIRGHGDDTMDSRTCANTGWKKKHVSPCGTASWVKPNWRHWLWLGALADLLTILRNIPRITLAPTCSHHTDLLSGRVFLRSQCESLSKDILQVRAMRWKSFCPKV